MRQPCTTLWISIVAVLGMLAAAPRTAQAQTQAGVRAGIAVNPDQVYFGGHVETAPLIDRLRFRPNVELGLGDNTTVAAFNFEFIYPFASRQQWHAYAGGGPAVNWFRTNGNSDAEAGFNLLFGLQNTKGLFFEAKFGVVNGSDLKFGVGYTLK